MYALQHLVPLTLFGLFSFKQATAAPLAPLNTTVVSSPFAAQAPIISSTLPLTAGSASLPAPAANLTLKHITIGHGIQNYTCATSNSTPVAIGAVATLYDITALALLDPTTAASIPDIAAYMPLNSALIPYTPLTIPCLGSFPILGGHYFSATGTPVFDLMNVREMLLAKKLADIKAPSDAKKGVAETGAVDWLALTSIDGSVGLKEVFRVVTAGGNAPPTCVGYTGTVSVPYSAMYHFYG